MELPQPVFEKEDGYDERQLLLPEPIFERILVECELDDAHDTE